MGACVPYHSGRIVGFEYKYLVWPHLRVIEPPLILRIFHTKSLDAYVVPAVVAGTIAVHDRLKQVDFFDRTCIANTKRPTKTWTLPTNWSKTQTWRTPFCPPIPQNNLIFFNYRFKGFVCRFYCGHKIILI